MPVIPATRLFVIGSLLLIGAFGISPESIALTVIPTGDTTVFDNPDGARQLTNPTVDCTTATGLPTTQCSAGPGLSTDEMKVATLVDAGSGDIITSTEELYAAFTVDGSDSTVLDARVTGGASWRGTLFALTTEPPGSIGATSVSYVITASLYDLTDDTEVGNTTVGQDSCTPSGIGISIPGTEIGIDGCRVEAKSSVTYSFGAKVTTGHDYEVRLDATCRSQSGLVGTVVACSFVPDPIAPILPPGVPVFTVANGFVRWDKTNVVIDKDISGQIANSTNTLVTAVSAAENTVLQAVDVVRQGALEAIRLLNTPQGLRASDFPGACGNGCKWPEKPPKQ